MESLEIFSGAGGLALGMKQAGFKHTALVEWDQNAVTTLKANFENIDIHCKDIQKFDYSNYMNVDVERRYKLVIPTIRYNNI